MEPSAINQHFDIERLLVPESFPHEVEQLRLLETHISWVVLTGPFAYKIKKPVSFGFVDYSTLNERKRFCELELELNRRFAPDLYLGVVSILEREGKLQILADEENKHGENSPVEYAVKMRQFPQDAIVASRLENPELTCEAVDEFGTYMAKFHDSIDIADPTNVLVQVEHIRNDAVDNFETLRKAFPDGARTKTLDRLEQWTTEQFQQHKSGFQRRLDEGKVRRCHGDLHLKNIIQLNGKLLAFDGIEFNEAFQWNDVLSELAFPVLDFVARGRPDLGWRLLNSYLEVTSDYAEMNVLRFYLVYRAMVRAKVGWLNPKSRGDLNVDYETKPAVDQFVGPWDKYLVAANYFAFDVQPKLSITHGFSGSGKSTVAMREIERRGGIRIRTDVERNRIVNQTDAESKYSAAVTEEIYKHVESMAKSILLAGFPVIGDATFLKQMQREPFQTLASKLNVEYRIIDCDAPFEELVRRIRGRKNDASEATVEVLKMQMRTHEPLTMQELEFANRSL